MLNALVIDDDEKLAELLSEYCAGYDIAITAAQLPSVGLDLLKRQSFDAVILDVMLPEMDGFEVCKAIRGFSEIPIIMLTARGDVMDRVIGIELGADDYLPKPFEPRELVARVHSIAKRKPVDTQVMAYDGLIINQQQRTVEVQDKPVELTTMEYHGIV